jgi:hypothetical protein
MTHSAEWTPAMRSAVEAEPGLKKRRALLTRFGWGVPDEGQLFGSSGNAVTMVVQDEFVPFTGVDYKMRNFRLHQLPWPRDALRDLGGAAVELRVTLSYFIEPSAGRRGWRNRYAYASHGLRFDLRRPNETTPDFVRRVNEERITNEEGGSSGSEQRTGPSGQSNGTRDRSNKTYGPVTDPTLRQPAACWQSTRLEAGGRTTIAKIELTCRFDTPF